MSPGIPQDVHEAEEGDKFRSRRSCSNAPLQKETVQSVVAAEVTTKLARPNALIYTQSPVVDII